MDTFERTITNETVAKKTDNIGFILYRMLFVILIALAIICVRYLSPKAYKEIKHYYDNYISVNITADYYLSEEL